MDECDDYLGAANDILYIWYQLKDVKFWDGQKWLRWTCIPRPNRGIQVHQSTFRIKGDQAKF